MKVTSAMESGGTTVPAVHLEFIRNQTGLSDGAGTKEVEEYHRALFLHHHAADLEQFDQSARTHEQRLVHLEGRLNEAHARLRGVEQLIPVDLDGQPDVKPTLPWNAWDRAMFVVAAMAIAVLMVFGVLNISFNLLESGMVTFVENPVRAYFWAALLPVGALAVKVGWDFLQQPRLRDTYLWTCLAVGIAGVLIWLASYAAVYPSLSKTTREQIESLSVFDGNATGGTRATNAAGVKWIDAMTVVSQAAAEIFLSAVLGMYMTALYTRHRPVRLAGNPLFSQYDLERRQLERDVEAERRALADARGGQVRLENQLAALLAFARSIFHKEAASQRDQSRQRQVLLDQISDQIRSQLQSVENHRAERGLPPETKASPGRNGR